MNLIRLITIVLLFSGCAQIRPITGGQKDVLPPQVVLYTPDSATTQFNASSFSLVFDEYVQTATLAQEMVVSPPLRRTPKVKLKKRTLTIAWNDTLNANTTYVFNLGNGVADVNENNIASGLMYVFSTGSYIDSLEVNALCSKAATTEPVKGARLLLLPHDSLLTSKAGLPASVAFSSDKGLARLPFLSENSYHLFALEDQNFNYKWDEGEALAFLDSSITPRWRDSSVYALRLSTPRPMKPFISEYKTDSLGRIAFAWDPFFSLLKVQPLSDSTEIFSHYNEQRDSLVFRILPNKCDREIKLRVALDTTTMDTLAITVHSEALLTPWKARWIGGSKTPAGKEHLLEVQRYAMISDPSKWTYIVDSTDYTPNVRLVDGAPGRFFVRVPGTKKSKGQLRLLPGALKDMLGNTNDTLQLEWSLLQKEDMGSIKLVLENIDMLTYPVIRLVDGNGKQVKDIPLTNRKECMLAELLPGEYSIYLYDDHNQNGLFDPAIMPGFIAPESLWMVASKLNVRANWEISHSFTLR
jgi:hypothetical protein